MEEVAASSCGRRNVRRRDLRGGVNEVGSANIGAGELGVSPSYDVVVVQRGIGTGFGAEDGGGCGGRRLGRVDAAVDAGFDSVAVTFFARFSNRPPDAPVTSNVVPTETRNTKVYFLDESSELSNVRGFLLVLGSGGGDGDGDVSPAAVVDDMLETAKEEALAPRRAFS